MAKFSKSQPIGLIAATVTFLVIVLYAEAIPDSTHQWDDLDLARLARLSSSYVQALQLFYPNGSPLEAVNNAIEDLIADKKNPTLTNQVDAIGYTLNHFDAIRHLLGSRSDLSPDQVKSALYSFNVTPESVVSNHRLALRIVQFIGIDWFKNYYVDMRRIQHEADLSPSHGDLEKLFDFLLVAVDRREFKDLESSKQDDIFELCNTILMDNKAIASSLMSGSGIMRLIKKFGSEWFKGRSRRSE